MFFLLQSAQFSVWLLEAATHPSLLLLLLLQEDTLLCWVGRTEGETERERVRRGEEREGRVSREEAGSGDAKE